MELKYVYQYTIQQVADNYTGEEKYGPLDFLSHREYDSIRIDHQLRTIYENLYNLNKDEQFMFICFVAEAIKGEQNA